MCNCLSVLVYLCICVLVYLWGGNRVEVRTSVGENKRTGMPHYGLATEWKPRPTLCHAPRIHCCLLRSQLSLTCQHMFTLITWNTSCHICHLSVVIFVTFPLSYLSRRSPGWQPVWFLLLLPPITLLVEYFARAVSAIWTTVWATVGRWLKPINN